MKDHSIVHIIGGIVTINYNTRLMDKKTHNLLGNMK